MSRSNIITSWCLCALLAAPAMATAQESDDAVTINLDVLYNLESGAGTTVERPALLPAPDQAPRSRLLVKPAPKPQPAVAAVPEPEPEPAAPTEIPDPAPVPAAAAAAVPAAETLQPPTPDPPPLPEVDSPEPSLAAAPAEALAEPIEPPPEVAAPEPAAPQTAALTPGPPLDLENPLRLGFDNRSADLDDQAQRALSDLAARLLGAEGQRIQLLAFAPDSGDGASVARRLSLSRALAVRSYLVERGVASGRIDVRALGTKFEDGPPDRVDVIYAKQ